MTDKDIIKALKCIAGEDAILCAECAFANVEFAFRCRKNVAKAAIDHIKRQQAEIERLNHIRAELSREIDKLKEACSIYEETTGLKQVRNDSIKKFADLLKATGGLYGEIWESDIDRVLKEMEDEK